MSPLRNDQDEIIAVVSVGKDVTMRRRAEAELREAKDAADKANRTKSAFLANMSHEIRTPMSAILGFTDLLGRNGLDDAKRQRYLGIIQRNGRHLMSLIDDILDLAKVEAGRLRLEKTTFPILAEVRNVMALLKPQAEAKKLFLKLHADDALPREIQSDSTRLRQILMNIVGNAIKFTESGGIDIAVYPTKDDTTPGGVVIDVKDTGCGLSHDKRTALFQAFSQADISTTRRFGGTGLGLFLSHKLALALGGDIQLKESTLGCGSTFTITVGSGPSMTSKEVSSVAPSATVTPTSFAAQRLTGRSILIVEDRDDVRDLYQTLLEQAGAKVETAVNGEDALRQVANSRFDLLLVDLQMPVMDGLEAMRRLRAQHFVKPIIALTSYSSPEERQMCLAAGFDDHLAKPVDANTLIAAVERWSRVDFE